MRPTTPDQRVAHVAARQHAAFTHAQALACGLSDHQIGHRVATGVWVRPTRGVYVIAGAGRSWRRELMVAVLAATDGAVASHLSALALHGLGTPSLLPHVLVPRGASARTRVGKIHRSVLGPGDRCTVDGIPCTSAPRTIVDCARMLDRPGLEQVVDDALCSGVASRAAILERLGVRGRQGVVLRDVLDVWSDAITLGSAAEARLLRLLADCGVDDVVAQYEVRDEAGMFVARVDAASPRLRQVWEYDSDRWHNPRRWHDDEQRHARLRPLGWGVDRVSKQDLMPSSRRIRDQLGAVVALWARQMHREPVGAHGRGRS